MFKKMFKNYDYTMIVIVLLLCAMGLVMVYSASMIEAVVEYGRESDHFFNNQLIWIFLGIIVFVVFMILPYKVYQKFIVPITLLMLLSLGSVLLFGKEVNYAKSWFSIAGFRIQPAEYAKLGIILYLSSVFSKKQSYISNFRTGIVPPLIVLSLVCFLIFVQPDLGSMMIIAMTAGVILFCSGMKWTHLTIMSSVLLFLAFIGFKFFLSNEQLSRFAAAYHPFEDPVDSGFQLINGYLALGTGGMFGKGLGQSVQKYGFLPEPHTDFIITIIAEELGFVGVFVIIAMLMYIVFKGMYTGLHCKDAFGSLLAIGISGMIGIQTIVNLGAASGILPVTGVTLPFISYGGSSLILLMMSVGILVNISMFVKYRKQQTPPADQSSDHSSKQKTKLKVVSQHRVSQ
ncbi:putative lipid II flippase FtsW [Pseudalkalibacillus berkeleyi]|uniref:Probable peptidoglycan glycosyltransferase FtsW n=1 Tax=Pseudalkalibacillus berkeleyi TaxID=1069813 RepID=A0ABS9GYS7_9BACL|nr:putative lipid II flippase FtsW [Pseudalkalibacillus berkeleyi]MCF6136966.1 putative lipid II flippase FtsW [Pseudalkalibacillus berkeleyi]